MSNIIKNGEICFFIKGTEIRYSPLSGEYRVFFEKKQSGVCTLKMFVHKGKMFLFCSDGDIEDLIFNVFGLRHNIYIIDMDGIQVVDFDVFGRYVKENCSEKK